MRVEEFICSLLSLAICCVIMYCVVLQPVTASYRDPSTF